MGPAGKIIDIDAFKKKESGLKSTRPIPAPKVGFIKRHWQPILIFALLLVALTVIVSPPRKQKVNVYPIGSIAPENIKAEDDILLEDAESTEKNRQAAHEATLDVYDYDSALEARVAERVINAFTLMYKGYVAYSKTSYEDLLQERERLESESDIHIDPLPKDRLAQSQKTIMEFERSDGFRALLEEFQNALGVKLESRTMAILRYYHFWPRIEEAVTSALHQPFSVGLAPSKSVLPRTSVKGIVMRDIVTGEERTAGSFNEIMDISEAQRAVREPVGALITGDKENLRKEVEKICLALLKPNLTFNGKETSVAKEAAAEKVNPVFFQVQKGEMIIREGERVTPSHYAKLSGMASQAPDTGWYKSALGSAVVCALLVAIGALFVWKHHEEVGESTRMQILMAILLAGHMSLLALFQYMAGQMLHRTQDISINDMTLAAPLVFGPLIVSMFFTVELTILFAIIVSTLTVVMLPDNPLIAFLTLMGGLVCAFHVRQYSKRTTLLLVGLMVGSFNMACALGMDLISGRFALSSEQNAMGLALAGGVVSAILVSGAVPILESLFPVVSDVKLLELTNLNHPLLRRMIMEAPGTYHHSIMVGNLAEEACKSIGANALLARAGALFHDIGKLKKSEYFSENQQRGSNPHDKLTPSMSTLVIVSHIRDGLEMAKKYKLLPQIAAMIPEHHGTQTIRWFYHKAKKAEDTAREEIREDNFKYPGPIPSSRESACVAMSDSIEAAARACAEPTSQRLKELVTEVINDKFIQGQLDNSHLTLHDIALITESFTRVLMGIHHHRIKYPDREKETNIARENADPDTKKAEGTNP
ncbi:MAG: HDIG domain-containing protein [Nitrospinota bacterium]|nr:HDIG domain-containing protein [Nitrospinota bacterium]